MGNIKRAFIGLPVVLNLGVWGYALFLYLKASAIIPLHYNVYFGIDLYQKKEFIFVSPFVGSLIIVVNFYLRSFIKEEILSFFLVLFSLISNIFLGISLLLINLNFVL